MSTSAVIEIADLGDIVLIVDQDEKEKRLRVSSHMLRAASKTLSVMFGPLFQEGQNLDVNEPKSIPLPDDDAEAMELVCRVIHLQNDSIPDKLDTDKVLTIAKLVDKYALHRTIYLAADRWLHPSQPAVITDLGKLMLAADLMNHDPGFRRITKALLYDTNGSYHQIAYNFPEADLWCAVYLLESRRSDIKRIIDRILKIMEYKMTRHANNCQCSFKDQLSTECTKLISGFVARKPEDVTISYILEQIKRIPDPDQRKARSYERCPAGTVHSNSYRTYLLGLIADVIDAHPYLCLACTRAGKITKHTETQSCLADAPSDVIIVNTTREASTG